MVTVLFQQTLDASVVAMFAKATGCLRGSHMFGETWPDQVDPVVKLAQTPNIRDVTRRAIIDVNSIGSGRNVDLLTSIINLNCWRHDKSATCASRAKAWGPCL